MKWSRYNFLFESDNVYFIYNSLSNSFAELDSETYFQLMKFKENDSVALSDEELEKQLISMKVLVEDDRDELNKIKYQVHKKRFYDKHLGLTINPTLHCNFACPYCFEGEHSSVYMTDEVENDIVEYIKKHSSVKSVHVTWFGGEPLLAFNRIVSLSNKIKALGLSYNAGMITNGYLFNEENILQLSSLSIQSIQITIDGDEKLHDSRRCLKSGKGTFKRIVENIELLQSLAPEIRLAIRVNIDKTNKDDFIGVYNFFREKKFPNLIVSPGFVEDISGCNLDDCIFNAQRKVDFLIEMQNKHGLDFSYFYPSNQRYECPVRNPNTIAIGPRGEIYKCWNDIGNESRIIGNINGKIQNESLLIRYLNGADPFEDENCKKCLLLPVCSGGCPFVRLKNEYENKNMEVCSLIKNNMKEFLLLHYKNKIQK